MLNLLLLALSFSSLIIASPTSASNPVATITGLAQASSVISRLSTYLTHLTAQPSFTYVNGVMNTAMPDSVRSSIEYAENLVEFGGRPTMTDVLTTQSWYTAMPSDVQSYLSSMINEEQKLVTATNYAVTPRMSVALTAVGVGIASLFGFVLLL